MFTYVFNWFSSLLFIVYSLLTLSLHGFRKCLSKTKTKLIIFIVRFFPLSSQNLLVIPHVCVCIFFLSLQRQLFFFLFFSCLVFFFLFLCIFTSLVYFLSHIGSAHYFDFICCTRSLVSSSISIYTCTFTDVHLKVLNFRYTGTSWLERRREPDWW